MTGPWWRRNRRWLLALPLALVVAVGSSAQWVQTLWYEDGLHHRIATSEPGEYVGVTDDYEDALGRTSRSLEVRWSDSGTWPVFSESGELRAAPPGLEVRYVQLDLKADPEVALSSCQVLVEDTDGRRYGPPDVGSQYGGCVPAETPGPSMPITTDQERGVLSEGEEPRPAEWTVRPRFLLPEGAEIRRVLIWWEQPEYVELPAP